MMLKLQPTPQMVSECAEKFGFNPKDLQDIITGGLINKAMSGDSRAFEVKLLVRSLLTGAEASGCSVQQLLSDLEVLY